MEPAWLVIESLTVFCMGCITSVNYGKRTKIFAAVNVVLFHVGILRHYYNWEHHDP